MERTITPRGQKIIAMLLAGSLSATVASCGGNKIGNVTGTVTFQGKPLPGGYVEFYCLSADGRILTQKTGAISDEGVYSVVNVPVGDVKITVQEPPGALEANMTQKGGMPKRARSAVTLPPKYQSVEQTDLKYTVTPGKQKYDVVMK